MPVHNSLVFRTTIAKRVVYMYNSFEYVYCRGVPVDLSVFV